MAARTFRLLIGAALPVAWCLVTGCAPDSNSAATSVAPDAINPDAQKLEELANTLDLLRETTTSAEEGQIQDVVPRYMASEGEDDWRIVVERLEEISALIYQASEQSKIILSQADRSSRTRGDVIREHRGALPDRTLSPDELHNRIKVFLDFEQELTENLLSFKYPHTPEDLTRISQKVLEYRAGHFNHGLEYSAEQVRRYSTP